MPRMKKLVPFILVILLAFVLVGCASDTLEPTDSQEDVDEIVNATLTAIAQNATSTPTPLPPPTDVPPTATQVPPTATPEPTATTTLNPTLRMIQHYLSLTRRWAGKAT